MANMQLLSRLGTAPLAFKYLVTPSAHFNLLSVSCSLKKLHSYPNPKLHDVSHDVESASHLEIARICGIRLLSSTFGQIERRKITSQVDGKVSPTYKCKSKQLQQGALLGSGGYDVLARGKSSLGSLTQQFMHVRHYNGKQYPVPEVLEPMYKMILLTGQTYSCYLSDENVERIRTLARSEFRSFSASFMAKRYTPEDFTNLPIRKFSEDKIFGLPLDLLRKKDIEFKKKIPQLKLPALLHMLLQFVYKNGLTTKDIFKSPEGSTKVKELREDIEANFYKTKDYEIGSTYNVHDVAAALKDFIAELQMPLVTTPEFRSFPDFFLKGMSLMDLIKGLQMYFQCMTPEHRDSLQMLLTVLNELTLKSAENGFTLEDCAEIFSPVLFALPPNLSEEEAKTKKKEFADLTRVLVYYNDRHFTILPFLIVRLHQVHKSGVEPDWFMPNKSLQSRSRMAFLDNVEFLIKPQDPKGQTHKIVVDGQTTVEEIMATATGEQPPMETYMEKLKCQILGKDSKTNHFLHEKGGFLGSKHDIDERVLEPDAKPIHIWRANTASVYVIKSWNGYGKRMSVKATGRFMGNFRDNLPDYGRAQDGELLPPGK